MSASLPAPAGLVVRLDLNTAPYLNEAAVERALRDVAPKELAMYPEPGVPRLEAEIAAAVGVAPNGVLVGNGSDELLDLAMRAFVPPGGSVGVVQPTFGMYDHFARACRVELRRVPTRDVLPVEALARFEADAYFVPSPNNPTGAVFPSSAFGELADRVRVPVVIDEAYAEFARQDLRPLARTRENVLVTRTFSKAYGLPGVRVGYAVGARPLLDRVRALRMPYNISSWSERVALAALRDKSLVERNVTFVEAERPKLASALESGGWPVWPSRANFLLVGPLPRAADIRAALRQRGIIVKAVDYPGGDAGSCFRITIGLPDENRRLLAALQEVSSWRA